MNHPHSPEITITVCTTTHVQEEDARWQTEDAPCFPRPLCVAIPPKRPDRQPTTGATKVAPDLTTTKTQAAPPRVPRRRVTLEPNKLEPIHKPLCRPTRQQTAMSDVSTESSLSEGPLLSSLPDTDTIEELSDDEASLSLRLNESLRLEEGDCGNHQSIQIEELEKMEGSSRDHSPTPPIRQKTEGMDALLAKTIKKCHSAPSSVRGKAGPKQQPEWFKLWESQGTGNNSLSTDWKF